MNVISEQEAEATERGDTLAMLKRQKRRDAVTEHEFLRYLRTSSIGRSDLAVIVQQYWFPIHHFTEFLPNVIAVTQELPIRTHVSRILWQELGEGDPTRAHESLYLETMNSAGITASDIRSARALPATSLLIEGYRRAVATPLSAIGFLYGTEVIDLVMVSAVGAAVRETTGVCNLPWVDVHLMQEPDHVASVNKSACSFVAAEDQVEVIKGAHEVWSLWSGFYTDIQKELGLVS